MTTAAEVVHAAFAGEITVEEAADALYALGVTEVRVRSVTAGRKDPDEAMEHG